MISWVSLVLSLVKIAVALQVWMHERKLLKAGEDRAVAAAALTLLEATAAGKKVREDIGKLTDTEAVDLWKRMLDA